MSLSPQIRAILLAGAKSVDDIAELISETPKVVQTALHQLKFQGKIRYKDIDGRRLYSLADWPEKASSKDAPPPQARRQENQGLARAARRNSGGASGQRGERRGIRHHRLGRARDQAGRCRDPDPSRVVHQAAHVHRARRIDLQPHGVTQ